MDVKFGYHHAKHYKLQSKSKKTLWISLSLTFLFALVEFFGGLLSHSLALISDSFHMFSDVAALGLSMLAIYYSAKKPNNKFTFGYVRFEIIAALINGLALLVIALAIAVKGIIRLLQPVEIDSMSMIGIASIGLLINVVLTLVLMRSLRSENNLNIRSALWHFIGDLLNSVGVIMAGILIYYTGIAEIDAIASLIISAVIFIGGYNICKSAFLILMEAVPPGLNAQAIRKTILSIDNVQDIHEFHLWSISDGLYSLSFHVLLERYDGVNDYEIVKNISQILQEKYNIDHVTIQIENPTINEHLLLEDH